jgi:hypothetical protein
VFASRNFKGLGLLAAFLAGVTPAVADAPIEAPLLEVNGQSVKLGKGGNHGISVGQIFDLYQEARVYRLPLTNGEIPLVKAQRRVARVQVVEIEPTTSQARVIIHDDGSDGKPVALEASALRALHNPTAVAPNRRPVFLDAPAYAAVSWRNSVALNVPVSNEADDAVVFTWTVTGGRLLHDQTIESSNRWFAPYQAGEYSLTVVARDSAGNEARTAVVLKSSGVDGRKSADRAPTTFKIGRSFGSFSGFGKVSDVTFDSGRRRQPVGRRFFLNPNQSTFGGTATVRVYAGEKLARNGQVKVQGFDFSALAASNRGHLYALDAERKTVQRYGFGGGWKDLFRKEAVEFGVPDGGTGNAHFGNPVDIAVSLEGDLYVLDAEQRCVQVFTAKGVDGKDRGVFLVSFGRPGKGPLELSKPQALAVARDGTVYVLDNGRKKVVVYKNWRPTAEFPVAAPEEELIGIAVHPLNGDVFVLNKKAVKRFSRSGRELGVFGNDNRRGHPARISRPVRARMDPTGVLWVIDHEGDAVARFSARGRFLGRKGGFEFSGRLRVAGSPDGGFAVLDAKDYRVTRFDSQGWVTARFGVQGTKADQFEDPVDLAISETGDVYVLDAGKKAVMRFSRQGTHVKNLGRPGSGRAELTGVRDLSAVNNRSYLTVVQQRPEHNFNLLHPGSGKSVHQFGKYGGDLTPALGCVVGITGSLGGGGRESASPMFWSADDDREHIYRWKRGGKPKPIKQEFDEISDMEVSVVNQVFVVDEGEDRVVVLGPRGSLVTVIKALRIDSPHDIGVDDYSRAYVYDKSGRIVELVPGN